MGATKALGPDGMNGLFYQKHWNLLQEYIFRAVQEFFTTGNLSASLNKTSITLIPKVAQPESLDQY